MWWMVAAALAGELSEEASVWTSELVQLSLHEAKTGPAVSLDLHFRANSRSGWLAIVRPAFGWDVGRGWSVWAGYGWIPSMSADGAWAHEHRAWEQALGVMKVDRVAMGARLRFEQRAKQGEEAVGLRARLWGRLAVDLTGPAFFVATDELFFGLNDPGWAPQGLDQNRAFVGFGLKASEPFRVEAGYLNVYIDRDDDIMLHAASVNVAWIGAVKKHG